MSGQIIQRLGPVRPLVERLQSLLHEAGLVAQLFQGPCVLQAGVPSLLLPSAHLRPLQIGLGGIRRLAGVAQGLREVELMARIVRVGFQGLRKKPDVAFEFVDAIGPAGVIPVPDSAQLDLRIGDLDEFVRHATIASARVPADQPRIPVADAIDLQDRIGRGLQSLPKTRVFDDQLHVGVTEQKVVIFEVRSVGAIQRCVARLLEVDEGPTAQLAGQAAGAEKRLDEFLGAVGRAGVADHPTGKAVGQRRKTPWQIRHLVLDDHIEAKSLFQRGAFQANAMQTGGVLQLW